MAKVTREKEMNVPVRYLARAITEFEAYPKFLPEVVSVSRVPGGTAERQKVVFELEVVKRFSYTLEFWIQGHEEISWHLDGSNFFKVNEGKWRLRAVDENRTYVNYEVEVGFGFFVPGWITRKLTEVNLPKMMDSFEGRAKTVMKDKSDKGDEESR